MVSELRQGTLVRTRIVFVTDRTYLFLLFSTPFVLSLFFILIFILNFLPVILRILVYFYFCLLVFFPIPSDYSPSVYFYYPSPFIFVFTSEFIPFFLSTTCTFLHLTSTLFFDSIFSYSVWFCTTSCYSSPFSSPLSSYLSAPPVSLFLRPSACAL